MDIAERFDLMKRMGCYYVICIEASDRIVACATLIVEHKFLHGCSQVSKSIRAKSMFPLKTSMVVRTH